MSAPPEIRRAPDTRADWETPWRLFRAINAEFHFTLDAAASAENHKVADYLTEQDDALTAQILRERIWCNPPYGRGLPRWVEAFDRWQTEGECTVVALLPANTDTEWFAYVWRTATEIRLLKGRVNFVGSRGGNTGGSMLAIYRPSRAHLVANAPVVRLWDWRLDTELSMPMGGA